MPVIVPVPRQQPGLMPGDGRPYGKRPRGVLTRWSRPGSTDAVPARPIDGILAKTGLDLTLR
jgi:hypothetical protein